MSIFSDRRSLAASFTGLLCTGGWIACAIGGLDAAVQPVEGPSEAGQAFLVRGAMVGMLGTILWAWLAWPSAGARKRSAIVAVGVWPFLTFGLFISWRIGVAAEQAVRCESGEIIACYDLGRRKQRRSKPEEARHWFALGCDGGSAPACIGLAAVTPDAAERSEALRSGCALESGPACDRLGRMLRSGEIEGSPDEAARVTARACELGVASACGS